MQRNLSNKEIKRANEIRARENKRAETNLRIGWDTEAEDRLWERMGKLAEGEGK